MLVHLARLTAVCTLLAGSSAGLLAQPEHGANAGFGTYVRSLEARLQQQHQTGQGFLAPVTTPDSAARLRNGEFLIENLTPANGPVLPGALLFHWRGTAFVPDAHAAAFESLLRDYKAYPKVFEPQVLQAEVLSREGGRSDHLQARIRVRQHHVITVVLDTTYDITYGRLDA